MFTTVNLPVQSVHTIVDIDDTRLEIPIEEAMNRFAESKGSSVIRSLFSEPTLIASSFRKDQNIDYNYGVSYINKITKKQVENVKPDIKYFDVKVKYFNDKVFNFLVPGYVKFFSKTLNAFVPVENMKKSDVLVDYAHNIVQMLKKTEYRKDDNPAAPEISEFYSIRLSNEKAEILVPFYFNGILSHVYYNDFQKNLPQTTSK